MREETLNLPMQGNDAGADTIRDYLVMLLVELWNKGECFSGKRPFGNSGWEYELYVPLIRAKVVSGELDEYGDIEDVDEERARTLIRDAIYELRSN